MSSRRVWTAMVAAAAVLSVAGCELDGPAATPSVEASVQVRVDYVPDGDTIDVVASDGTEARVRMLGIDAPEVGHDGDAGECGAASATKHLRTLLADQKVALIADVRSDDTDQYGRQLRYVQIGADDAALVMLQAGLVEAWYPSSEPQPSRYADYKKAENEARQAGVGSWATCSTLGR